MSKSLVQLLVDYSFHTAAAELCISQARHFERSGDTTNAEDAHADAAYHIAQAARCCTAAAAAQTGLAPASAA